MPTFLRRLLNRHPTLIADLALTSLALAGLAAVAVLAYYVVSA